MKKAFSRIGCGVLWLGHGLDRVVSVLSYIFFVVACAAVVVVAISLNTEVFARYILNMPTKWAWEVTGYLSVVIIFLSMAEIQKQQSHLQVGILTERFSDRGQAIWYVLGAILIFIWAGMLAWYGGAYAWEAFLMGMRSESALKTPLAIPISLIPLGVGLFLIQLLVQVTKRLPILMSKDRPGPKTPSVGEIPDTDLDFGQISHRSRSKSATSSGESAPPG